MMLDEAFQRARRHDKRVDAGVLCSTIEEHGITNLFVTSEIEEAILPSQTADDSDEPTCEG